MYSRLIATDSRFNAGGEQTALGLTPSAAGPPLLLDFALRKRLLERLDRIVVHGGIAEGKVAKVAKFGEVNDSLRRDPRLGQVEVLELWKLARQLLSRFVAYGRPRQV
jgi:hypothetical protein